MFTGIITDTGKVAGKTRTALEISAERNILRALKKGGSIAVDGACLTVASKNADSFSADVMPETFKRTNFSSLTARCVVNLELPATPKSFLSGHIVQGHIDGTATIKKIRRSGNSCIYYFTAPAKLLKYMVEKGSVAINGISLTLIDVTKGGFSAGVIPHTKKNTALSSAKAGDDVNVEVDILAKYVNRLINRK